MSQPRSIRVSLASVFLTFFVDNLCWSIVFPIFAPYFFDSGNHVFDSSVDDAMRAFILGCFLMAFSLGQFLGAPIVGEYADRHGRKRALLLTVFFTLIGLVITALSMNTSALVWLFIGRLITGIFASNTSICLAAVTDLSHNEKAQAKYFGYFSVIAGLSFIVGAFLGGKLSDPSIDASFSPMFPLWIASGLTLFNLFFILFGFRETAKIELSAKFTLFECFKNIKQALRTKKIKRIYAIYFLFLFSWTILFQFVPVVVVEKFHFTSSNIADLALFMGICWAIGSGYLNKFLSGLFSSRRILTVSLLIFTCLAAFVAFPNHIYTVLGLVGPCVMIGGLAWPLCNSVISNLAPREIQGKILGMSQSVQSLAMAIAPLVGGVAFQANLLLPFFIGATASFVAWLIFVLKVR